MEAEDGTQTVVLNVVGRAVDVNGVWRTPSISMDRWAGQAIHLRFVAEDGGANNLVEVEIDDVRITRGELIRVTESSSTGGRLPACGSCLPANRPCPPPPMPCRVARIRS